MTKGYCKCGKVIDEVELSEFGMCYSCYMNRFRVSMAILYGFVIAFFPLLAFIIYRGLFK